MNKDITITDSKEGQFLGIAGGNYRIIISGDQTNGSYAVIEMVVPPNGGPPPHAHEDTQEMFYVLEGEVEFKTENEKKTVGKDGFINIPLGGAVHCFKNQSNEFARLLCTVVPAGLEKMFLEIGEPVAFGEFLKVPELTEERKQLLKQLDLKYNQKTYPPDFLD
ncbi:cupin domain-containing protein [Chryseobacterium sp. 09-1422]|uniref:Cupin domain-containing protein n=1 Tax=Chryseobacterium kimseyorum TaxID=2984028 RepID=A0ABT3HW70_9FLAO|nr:cupin domain-containing protein [Chryseobacterium kimseyorum]MCW3168049.1 cupin domain-containing protein [Chryseobacterium kimseyorum]